MSASAASLYPCPVCGYVVFCERPGNNEICPICFWEDDIVQLRFVQFPGGANKPSLVEAQKNFLELGAVEARFREHVRAPRGTDRRAEEWVPFDPSRHVVEHSEKGVNYGDTYPNDSTSLYYWRRVRQ
jgi:hypothetical protein